MMLRPRAALRPKAGAALGADNVEFVPAAGQGVGQDDPALLDASKSKVWNDLHDPHAAAL
jgi:hypothetical protein